MNKRNKKKENRKKKKERHKIKDEKKKKTKRYPHVVRLLQPSGVPGQSQLVKAQEFH